MQDVTFLIILIAWLLGLSVIVFWIFRYFKRLTGVDEGNLIKVLTKVLDKEAKNRKDINDLEKEIFKVKEDAVGHIQKIGLVRFNPFKELGGDHSFCLTLLDADDNGVIITGLHTRERTRVYVKNVKEGKARIKLSDEESRALKKALKKS